MNEDVLRDNMYVFWHIYVDSRCVERCAKIIRRQFSILNASRLIDKAKAIYICYVGTVDFPTPEVLRHPKISITSRAERGYEEVTTRLLHKMAKVDLPKESCVLYIHNKGVRWEEGSPPWDWAKAMEYFVIERHEAAVSRLSGHMTAGPFLSRHTEPRLRRQGVFAEIACRPCWIYSGNMWWARTEYIRMLHAPPEDDRLGCGEDWVLGKVNDKLVREVAFDLHEAPRGMDLYKHHYPRRMYCDD